MKFLDWYVHSFVPRFGMTHPSIPDWMSTILFVSGMIGFGVLTYQLGRYMLGFELPHNFTGKTFVGGVMTALFFIPPIASIILVLASLVGGVIGIISGVMKIRQITSTIRENNKLKRKTLELERQEEERRKLTDPYYQYGLQQVEQMVGEKN